MSPHDPEGMTMGPVVAPSTSSVWRAAALASSWKPALDRKSTRLNSSHVSISYAVFCLKKKKYKELLVKTLHKLVSFALGGMSAFIPNQRDPAVTENALSNVHEYKDTKATNVVEDNWFY